jgi:hypothetical protein
VIEEVNREETFTKEETESTKVVENNDADAKIKILDIPE